MANAEGAVGLRERVAQLPRLPGVYLWKDAHEEVLYVGKAKDLRARTRQYVQDGAHKPEMMEHAADVDYIAVRNNKEALVLEQTLIKRHRPRYNVRLTDDKQYPYLKLTKGPYPRLLKTHRRLDDGATYFGPFPDGYGAFHVLGVLNDLFPLRRCKTVPDHKCLYYDIGKCAGPCIDACTDAEYDAIVQDVKHLLKGNAGGLLKRLKAELKEAAHGQRFEAAAKLRDQLTGLQGVLEKQHMVHDRLQDRDIVAMEARGDRGVVVLLHQRGGKVVGQSAFQISGIQGHDQDVQAFLVGHYADRTMPRFVSAALADGASLEADLRLLAGHTVTVETPKRGDKRRWLEVAATNARLRMEEDHLKRQRRGMGAVEALRDLLGLAALPRVIEGFDVSHQAGRHTRAAMVRFVDGEPQKAGYRTFNMRTVGQDAVDAGTAKVSHGVGREVDDFASMEEAVARRYARLQAEGQLLPDLVLIDGGSGQLKAARAALRAVGVDVALCSLAKQEEEVFLPGRMHPIRAARNDAGLQLLQRVRDESHRFGITQVRRKARQSLVASPLDGVRGIGPRRRHDLVRAFGGLDGLRAASPDDLARFPGVTPEMAKDIIAALAKPETPAPN